MSITVHITVERDGGTVDITREYPMSLVGETKEQTIARMEKLVERAEAQARLALRGGS